MENMQVAALRDTMKEAVEELQTLNQHVKLFRQETDAMKFRVNLILVFLACILAVLL